MLKEFREIRQQILQIYFLYFLFSENIREVPTKNHQNSKHEHKNETFVEVQQ